MVDAATQWQAPLPESLKALDAEADKQIAKASKVVIHNPDLKKPVAAKTPADDDILSRYQDSSRGDDEDFRVKYEVLRGKFDKQARDFQDLQAIVNAQRETINNLNQLVLNLKTTRDDRQPDEDEDRQHFNQDDLSEDDFQGYGPEMKTLLNKVKTLEQKNADQEQRLQGIHETAAETEHERFIAKVLQACPHFEAVNSLPEFAEWLGQGWKKEKAQQYANERNAVALAEVVNDWIRETGWTPSGGKHDSSQGGLGDQVIPDTSSSQPGRGTKTPKVSQAQYQQAVLDYTRGTITEAQLDKVLLAYNQTVQEEQGRRRR